MWRMEIFLHNHARPRQHFFIWNSLSAILCRPWYLALTSISPSAGRIRVSKYPTLYDIVTFCLGHTGYIACSRIPRLRLARMCHAKTCTRSLASVYKTNREQIIMCMSIGSSVRYALSKEMKKNLFLVAQPSECGVAIQQRRLWYVCLAPLHMELRILASGWPFSCARVSILTFPHMPSSVRWRCRGTFCMVCSTQIYLLIPVVLCVSCAVLVLSPLPLSSYMRPECGISGILRRVGALGVLICPHRYGCELGCSRTLSWRLWLFTRPASKCSFVC